MNVKGHLIRTKVYPAVLAKISLEDSKCAVLGVAVADGSMYVKIHLCFGVEHTTEIAIEFQTFNLLLVHVADTYKVK